jgi:hypothetical protein
MASRVNKIADIVFFDAIFREYRVGVLSAQVSVETAMREGVIGLVRPRTKLDFQQLVAQSLADVAGVGDVAQARALSNAFLPLVLCQSKKDMEVYLERMGVKIRGREDNQKDLGDTDNDAVVDNLDEIARQLIGNLGTDAGEAGETENGSSMKKGAVNLSGKSSASPPPSPPSFALPNLNDVTMALAQNSGQQIQPAVSRGGAISSGSWAPPNATEIERDRAVGHRGEELVYRMELKRVQDMGYKNPDDMVVWTSQFDPGADHDIKSIGEDGRVRWIEVKATTGTDGRFEWSRKEFKKALREGDCYELWRVYLAGTTSPIVKCFVNPIAMFGVSRLLLELGSLRACVENLGG